MILSFYSLTCVSDIQLFLAIITARFFSSILAKPDRLVLQPAQPATCPSWRRPSWRWPTHTGTVPSPNDCISMEGAVGTVMWCMVVERRRASPGGLDYLLWARHNEPKYHRNCNTEVITFGELIFAAAEILFQRVNWNPTKPAPQSDAFLLFPYSFQSFSPQFLQFETLGSRILVTTSHATYEWKILGRTEYLEIFVSSKLQVW